MMVRKSKGGTLRTFISVLQVYLETNSHNFATLMFPWLADILGEASKLDAFSFLFIGSVVGRASFWRL